MHYTYGRQAIKRFAAALAMIAAIGSINGCAGFDTRTSSAAQRLCADAALVSQAAIEGDVKQEISGLAASRSQPGVYWAHRDSGNGAELLAFDDRGRLERNPDW